MPFDRILEQSDEEVMNKEQKRRRNDKEFKGFRRAKEITTHILAPLVFLLSFLPFNLVRNKDVNNYYQYYEVRSNSSISRVPASGSARKLQHNASQTTYT